MKDKINIVVIVTMCQSMMVLSSWIKIYFFFSPYNEKENLYFNYLFSLYFHCLNKKLDFIYINNKESLILQLHILQKWSY